MSVKATPTFMKIDLEGLFLCIFIFLFFQGKYPQLISAYLCVPLRLCGKQVVRAHLPQRRRGTQRYAEKKFELRHMRDEVYHQQYNLTRVPEKRKSRCRRRGRIETLRRHPPPLLSETASIYSRTPNCSA